MCHTPVRRRWNRHGVRPPQSVPTATFHTKDSREASALFAPPGGLVNSRDETLSSPAVNESFNNRSIEHMHIESLLETAEACHLLSPEIKQVIRKVKE